MMMMMMIMLMMLREQVAVCCSAEQLHTQEFIRTIEPSIVIDDDTAPSPTIMPPIGEFGDHISLTWEKSRTRVLRCCALSANCCCSLYVSSIVKQQSFLLVDCSSALVVLF